MDKNLTLEYRPKTLDDVVGQPNIIRILKRQIETNSVKNAYLFTGAFGCVDNITEYFNGKEWKPISCYTHGEKVLQYNPITKNGELVVPMTYIKLPDTGLYEVKSKYGLNMCFSDEHRVIYESSKGNLNEIQFAELRRRMDNGLSLNNYNFLTTFKYSSCGISYSDIEIKLMCAVICDGTFRKNYKTPRVTLNLKKDRKIQEIRNLLIEANIEYLERAQKNGYVRFTFNAPAREKIFYDYWYDCNEHQLQLICDNILKWDGTIYNNRKQFSTASIETANFVQFAFTACGYRVSIYEDNRRDNHTYYTLSITPQNKIRLPLNLKYSKIKSDGFKYCFTVPTGMWVMRRNYRILITGNCGKTTSARALAYELNGVEGSAVEIDGASNNGVDNIRALIEDAQQRSIAYTYKIFILDEVHMLTTQAWNAALKIIEEPPKNCIFIFCTTDPQKIPQTILSRVQRFDFKCVPYFDIVARLKYIAKEENISCDEKALLRLAYLSKGHLRDAVKYFQNVAETTGDVSLANVNAIFGLVDEEAFTNLFMAFINNKFDEMVGFIDKARDSFPNMVVFYDAFTEFVMDCLVYVKTGKINYTKIVDASKLDDCVNRVNDIYKLVNKLIACKKSVTIDNAELVLKLVLLG